MNINRIQSLLETVVQWEIPKVWDDDLGRFVSYGYKYGSNGERDYMRKIVQKALDELKKFDEKDE